MVKYLFQKGHKVLGGEETRFKKGHKAFAGIEETQFKKGQIPWNKIRTSKYPSIMKNHKKVSHLVWCSRDNLPYVPKGFVIHHLDLNPENNQFENLQLLPRALHIQFHSKVIKIMKGGI